MFLTSKSFAPYDYLPARLVFGEHDPHTKVRLAGNRNPHLAWHDAPAGTRSFAILCVDPDVPSRGDDVNQEGREVPIELPRVDFFHWVVADLPATLMAIDEGVHSDGVRVGGKAPGPTPTGGLAGVNDYTGWFRGHPDMGGVYAGYDGPGPPWNDRRVHGYRFQVFALDIPTLGVSGPFTGHDLRAAMAGHVLASCELVGLHSTNPNVLSRRSS
jgi:Raf kinase inhibitor-like YbhB/YbcL family protein